MEDRALSAVEKRKYKGLEETASQEVEREIMIRDIHPGIKLVDKALLAVEKEECKGLEELALQEIMIRDFHPGTRKEDRALTAVGKELPSSLEDELEPSLEGGKVVRELRQELGRN